MPAAAGSSALAPSPRDADPRHARGVRNVTPTGAPALTNSQGCPSGNHRRLPTFQKVAIHKAHRAQPRDVTMLKSPRYAPKETTMVWGCTLWSHAHATRSQPLQGECNVQSSSSRQSRAQETQTTEENSARDVIRLRPASKRSCGAGQEEVMQGIASCCDWQPRACRRSQPNAAGFFYVSRGACTDMPKPAAAPRSPATSRQPYQPR